MSANNGISIGAFSTQMLILNYANAYNLNEFHMHGEHNLKIKTINKTLIERVESI